MYRGTTPDCCLEVENYDLTNYTIFVTLTQGSKIFDLTGDRLIMEYNEETNSTIIYFSFSQKDTLSFDGGYVKLQIRAVDADGNAIASNIASFSINGILKDGVITYER